MASAPYDAFVWDSPSRARLVAQRLWDAGAGEVTPGTCTVWRDALGIVAVLAGLDGRQLQRARLRSAMVLSRSEDFVVSESERSRAGIAATTLLPVPHHALYLARLAVHPRARGKGIGPQLLAPFLDLAVSRDDASIWLEVAGDNPTAIRLYERSGFERCGECTASSSDGRQLHFVHMRRGRSSSSR